MTNAEQEAAIAEYKILRARYSALTGPVAAAKGSTPRPEGYPSDTFAVPVSCPMGVRAFGSVGIDHSDVLYKDVHAGADTPHYAYQKPRRRSVRTPSPYLSR